MEITIRPTQNGFSLIANPNDLTQEWSFEGKAEEKIDTMLDQVKEILLALPDEVSLPDFGVKALTRGEAPNETQI